MAYNPIISGQLTREEIELASKDENKELQIKNTDIEISSGDKKIKKYIPLSIWNGPSADLLRCLDRSTRDMEG